MSATVASYLPDSDGLLPYFLLYVRRRDVVVRNRVDCLQDRQDERVCGAYCHVCFGVSVDVEAVGVECLCIALLFDV